MKVNVEKIDNQKIVLEIEIPQAEVAKALDKAYHKIAGQVNIPGFRKGKVPRNILEKRVGKEALLEEAFEIMAPQYYMEAIVAEKIEPVSRPQIEVVTLKEDQPVVFKAIVTPKPEVTLGEYKGVSVAVEATAVTDADVDSQLEALRNRHAKMVVTEGAELQNGDFAIIDFEGSIDGVPFEGGAGKAYPLEIGSGSFIPGFEEQLIGVKAGEEKDVNVAFPEDYHVADLAGKPAVFKVTVQDVKRKELPALDDEFAKEVSEFATIEELKADNKNKLEQAAVTKADNDFKNGALQKAVENAAVEVPDVMVEERIDHMVEDLSLNLQSRGMQLEMYLDYVKMDMNTLRSNYRETATVNVKTDLVLEAVAKAEALELTEEDVTAEFAAMAETYKAPAEEIEKIIRAQGRMGALESSILRKKAIQVIVDSAVKA